AGSANLRAFSECRGRDGQGRGDPLAFARRPSILVERPHDRHRAFAAGRKKRRHAAEPEGHTASRFAAGEIAAAVERDTAVRAAAVGCLSSGCPGWAGAGATRRLAWLSLQSVARGGRSQRSKLEAAITGTAARHDARVARESLRAIEANRQ